jgi:hypothetical protein
MLSGNHAGPVTPENQPEQHCNRQKPFSQPPPKAYEAIINTYVNDAGSKM